MFKVIYILISTGTADAKHRMISKNFIIDFFREVSSNKNEILIKANGVTRQ